MKLLKLLVISVVILLATVSAADAAYRKTYKKGRRDKINYSIRTVWANHGKKDKCISRACTEKWENDVQTYHDGCEGAFAEYAGDANPLGAVVMDSFRQFLTIVMQYANSNSTILSGSATSILESMRKCSKLRESSMVVLIEFEKVFPTVADDLNNVALKLSDNIGHVAEYFTVAVDEFSTAISQFMRDFLSSFQLTGCENKVDFEPTLRKLQKLMNLVALIAETLIDGCDPKIEVEQAVLVLCTIFWYYQIIAQGVNSAVMDIQIRNNCGISDAMKSLSLSFDYVLVSITQGIAVIVAPFVKTIREFLSDFVNTTLALNSAIKDIFGVFDGVAINVGEIARNLFKSLNITSTSTGRTNILRGGNFNKR